MSDSADDKCDFFVSYNEAERAWATWIAWQLEEAGYSVIIQAWDFHPAATSSSRWTRRTGSRAAP